MFDDASTNSSATFLEYNESTSEWDSTIENVDVFYEPQGTSYVNESTGDVVHREERILGPLSLDQYVDEGDRLSLTFRGNTYEWRVTSLRARSYEGFEGYVQMEFEDFGDEDTDNVTGGDRNPDWDIG